MGTARCRVAETPTGEHLVHVSALEGHRIWADSYDSGDNPVLALERSSMAKLLDSVRPTTVLDVACGSGSWLLRLQKARINVLGVDFCAEMLVKATRLSSLRGRVVLGDAECLPFRADTADLVLCSMALGYFHDLEKVFHEFARVAIPGATIAISDLHPEAVSVGWKRSFRANNVLYEIDHSRYSLQEIDDAAKGCGLRNASRQFAYLGQAEFPIFQSHGMEESFSKVNQIPALYLHTWKKPC